MQGRSPGCRGLTWWRPGGEVERELGKKEMVFSLSFQSKEGDEREGGPTPSPQHKRERDRKRGGAGGVRCGRKGLHPVSVGAAA